MLNCFRDPSNVYDSLGEAYMKSGDKEKAVINYEKSLDVNPENNNAGRCEEVGVEIIESVTRRTTKTFGTKFHEEKYSCLVKGLHQ